MLPFEPAPPLLGLSRNEVTLLRDRGGRLVEFVEDQNNVNYPDDLQRLPDANLTAQRLRKHSITEEACAATLWAEGRSLRILPVRTSSLSSGGIVYAASKPSLLNLLVSRFTQNLYKAYQAVHGKNANLLRMREEFAENPWRLEASKTGTGQLSTLYYVTCDLTDYQAHFEEEVRALGADAIEVRRSRAYDLLEAMAGKTAASATGPQEQPPVVAVRRAVDQPAWKAFERNRKGGVAWAQVRSEFGDEMMFRIILRRQDYGPLLSLLRQDADLASPSNRAYVAGCLRKIRENDDIGEERQAAFTELESWLAT